MRSLAAFPAVVLLASLPGCDQEDQPSPGAPNDAGRHAHSGDGHHNHHDAAAGGGSDAGHVHGDGGAHTHDGGSHHDDDGGPSGHGDAGHHAADGAPHHHGDGGHRMVDAAAPPDGSAPDPAVVEYCNCMLVTCHDLYHEIWGADEAEARAACLHAGAELPRAGEPVTQGDFLECRLHFCEAAGEAPEACDEAGGREVCRSE